MLTLTAGLRCCRSFVLKHLPLKMCWVPGYSDYYLSVLWRRPGGRSIEPKPFNAQAWCRHGRAGARVWQGSAQCGCGCKGLRCPNQLKRHPPWQLRSMKVGAQRWVKATGKNLVGMGRALIGPLRIGLQRAGVPAEPNTAFTLDLFRRKWRRVRVYVRDFTRWNPLSRS